MRITNAKQNRTYTFTQEEVIELLMYAYGYVDLVDKKVLPIFYNDDYKAVETREKLRQCYGDVIDTNIKIKGRS